MSTSYDGIAATVHPRNADLSPVTCMRCRQLKTKCSRNQPQCKRCQRKGLSCKYPDPPTSSSTNLSSPHTSSGRKRTRRACTLCRSLKVKCNQQRPICGSCAFKGLEKCDYGDAVQSNFRAVDARSSFMYDSLPSDSGGPSGASLRFNPSGAPMRFNRLKRPSSGSQSSFGGLSSGGASEASDANPEFSNWHSEEKGGKNKAEEELRILKELKLDLTGRIWKLDTYPCDTGGAADIYQGSLGTNLVAIKIFRRFHAEPEESGQKAKMLYETVRTWKELKHPNVLICLGIARDLGLSPGLISPFCPGASILRFLAKRRPPYEDKLKMLSGIADGLRYLHDRGIIHGNLCTKKILMNEHNEPVLSGYGMFAILGSSSATTSMFSIPIRYSPPEYFSDEIEASSVRTTGGDVYAMAMVMLEILTGLPPFHHLASEHAVFKAIIKGGEPIREGVNQTMITTAVWTLLSSMWSHSPDSRPVMSKVVESLLDIRGNSSTTQQEALSAAREAASKQPDDGMGHSSGEETTFGEVRDLTGRITQDDPYPFAGGGNANVYRGKLARANGSKIRVAIKMIRISDDGSGQPDEIIRRMKREVEVWSHLKHKNILPFIGVCEDLPGAPWPVLISPYYKSGNVGTYIKKHPDADRQALVLGVTCGLQFLHENNVVHGDLKVQNILVNKHGMPCICDFGISKIVSRRGFTTSNVGTAPYMAPELFFLVDGSAWADAPHTTASSDIYSFALLVLEILTGEPPKRRPSRPILTLKVVAELRPRREDYDEKLVADSTWEILRPSLRSDPP
ncbi:kinase-like domain-containing protein [Mycena amicta]|nr:kinase-like domain-containing protein [Mycena amicta]